MAAQLLEGKGLAEKIRVEVGGRAAALAARGVTPCLAALQVGEDPASAVYLKSQRNSCSRAGIDYRLVTLPAGVDQAGLAEALAQLNADPAVSGVILQMPLPGHLDARAAQALIAPDKDVEGLNPANLGRLVLGRPRFVPCTAGGIMELLATVEVDLYGREAVVVGHSEIVGKPLALLLLSRFATVTVCHIATGERGSLPAHVGRAEVLIVAVGRAGLIRGDWVREGAVVVDVGINRVGGRLVGDVEFDRARERAAWITPVPGGVGPLTVALLLRNTVSAAEAAADSGAVS